MWNCRTGPAQVYWTAAVKIDTLPRPNPLLQVTTMPSQSSFAFQAQNVAAPGRRRFLKQSTGAAAAAFLASTLAPAERARAEQPAAVDPKLIVHTRDPLNAEPPLAELE